VRPGTGTWNRSALIRERQHGGLRDAEIGPVEVVLSVRAPGRARPALPTRARLAWALGAALLGFNHLPSVQDLQACIARAMRLAEALEEAL
jgi:hypothetical protein